MYHKKELVLNLPSKENRIPDKIQSAQMSKITNDSLTQSGTGCFVAVPI